MKTILTLDKANQPFGFPQLNSGGTFDNVIATNITGTTISAATYLNLPIKYYAEPTAAPTNSPVSIGVDAIAIGDGAQSLSTNTLSFGTNAGLSSTTVNGSVFIGLGAGGSSSSSSASNFIGASAGSGANGSFRSNFLGYLAGQGATGSYNSNFLGEQAGYDADNANNSNFFGFLAGENAKNQELSNFFGFQVGQGLTGGSNNIIIGTNISLSNGVSNAINIGGVLFGTDTYSSIITTPSTIPSTNGKIGIKVFPTTYTFDVGGTASIRGYLYLQPSSPSNSAVIINQNSTDGSLVWGGSNLNLNSNFGSTNIIISPTGTYNSMSGTGNTILGRNAGNTLTTGNGNTLIGRNAGWGLTTGTGNIIIGRGDATNLSSSLSQSIHIVTDYSSNDASNMPSERHSFIGGGFGEVASIQNYYFGQRPFTTDTTGSTVSNLDFHPPSGLGTNSPGSSFRLNGGRGTGNGTPGDVIFRTSTSGASSSTLQTLLARWWVKGNTGYLGNLSSPTNNLHVTGTTDPVRFEGLQSGSTDTRILTSDSNGVIGYRNISSTYSTTGLTLSSQTLTTSFNYYGVNYNGNVDLTLPSPVGNDGTSITIKDEGGYSGTYRIRLTPPTGTIDGGSYADMNINYMSLTLMARNNNWWII